MFILVKCTFYENTKILNYFKRPAAKDQATKCIGGGEGLAALNIFSRFDSPQKNSRFVPDAKRCMVQGCPVCGFFLRLISLLSIVTFGWLNNYFALMVLESIIRIPFIEI